MVKRDTYQIVTLENGKADASAIMKVFADMAAGRIDNDLRLLNYYHEVPLSYGASILSIEEDSVELNIDRYQALVINHDKHTLLKSRHFHNELGVHGIAAYISIPKERVVLQNFAYAKLRAERRERVRVRMSGELPVVCACGEASTLGTILDMSETGVSVLFHQRPEIKLNEPHFLSFPLMDISIKTPATFVRALERGGHCICIFQLEMDTRTAGVVSQFIYQRQVEIIRELKETVAVEE